MLFFDIETKCFINLDTFADEFEIKAPENYKDPEKIHKYVEEKRKETFARLALDPDYSHIVSFACMERDNSPLPDETCMVSPSCATIQSPDDEPALLETVVEIMGRNHQFCGWNIIDFDFLFIARRCMRYGIRLRLPEMRRYKVDPVYDLMQVMFGWGAQKYKSLKTICKLYRLPTEALEGAGWSGADVAGLTFEQLELYNKLDVARLIVLYDMMKGIYF
jgi:DNA polymerase elongation subunit (family B)